MNRAGALRVVGAVGAVATLVVLIVLFWTAGQLVQDGAGLDAHGTAAVAVHVTSGIAAVALGLRAVLARVEIGPAALAVVVFAGTFGQAALGSFTTLAVHITCAVLLVLASACLAFWLLIPARTQQSRNP